jgi:L-threonylcarbamoyladenylate synthase
VTATPIEQAAEAVAGGAVVIIPTDTVYGLACTPRSPEAVEQIYRLKRRPPGLELTLLAAGQDDLTALVEMDAAVRAVADAFWPGALSIILPARAADLSIPRSGTTLSVRVPAHPLVRALLELTGPLATTSANRHGQPAAVTAAEAVMALDGEVPLVLDGGPGGGQASTIIDCANRPPRLVREGPVTWLELAPFLGITNS